MRSPGFRREQPLFATQKACVQQWDSAAKLGENKLKQRKTVVW